MRKTGLRRAAVLALAAALAAQGSIAFAQHSRPRRLNSRPNPHPSIPAGSRVVPAGMIVILRLEGHLNSSVSRPSDRFTARVQGPVKDAAGYVVLPAEGEVIGHVTAVTPAQLGRRSGVIAVTFDKVRFGTREYAVRAELVSADEAEREKLDADGGVTGGPSAGGNFAFIGGGAATGAVIGAIAGGALLGAGIGAGIGATAVLLSKGKEAVVEPGTLIGMRLTASLDLNQPVNAARSDEAANNAASRPASAAQGLQQPTPAPTPTQWQPVNVSFVQAERTGGNGVLVMITAETRSAGWRIKADHQITRDALEVTLLGLPPEGAAAQATSHPTMSLTVPDQSGAVRRVVVRGANGERHATVRLFPIATSSGQ